MSDENVDVPILSTDKCSVGLWSEWFCFEPHREKVLKIAPETARIAVREKSMQESRMQVYLVV